MVDAVCDSNPELPDISLIFFTIASAINIVQMISRLLILMNNPGAREGEGAQHSNANARVVNT